jgi:lipid II:glycine glycyltransferase (peptidoglycan interpeptide bridge formation enzyme)
MSIALTTPPISIRGATEADARALADFVRGVPMGTGFQNLEWASLKKAEGWDFDALLAVRQWDGRREQIAGSALILHKRMGPVSIAYAPRGPVFADPSDNEVASALLRAMVKQARARGAIALRISPDIDQSSSVSEGLAGQLAELKFQAVDDEILHTSTMRLDVTRTEDELMAGLEKRALSAIKKGLKEGVVVKSDLDGAKVGDFYRLLEETRTRHDFSIPEDSFFKRAADMLLPSGLGRCFVAYAPDGEPLAGAFALLTESRLLYVWGASTDRRRNLNASQVMHWQMILWAKQHGLSEYDFHGVRVTTEGEPGWGVYLFKRAFGGQLVNLMGEYEIALNPLLYPLYRRLRSRTKA